MSKKAERKKRAEERKKEQRKKLVAGGTITIIFAAIMLVLGVVGFIGNRSTFNDYKSTTDERTVDGLVTSVEVKSRKDDYGTKYFYYKAKVFYTVDGTDYEDFNEYDSEVKVGDQVTVKVYKSKDGTFKVPEITNEDAYKLYNLLYIGVAVFGLLLIAASIFVLMPEREKK